MKASLTGLLALFFSSFAFSDTLKMDIACIGLNASVLVINLQFTKKMDPILKADDVAICEEYAWKLTSKLNTLTDDKIVNSNFICKNDEVGTTRIYRHKRSDATSKAVRFLTLKGKKREKKCIESTNKLNDFIKTYKIMFEAYKKVSK